MELESEGKKADECGTKCSSDNDNENEIQNHNTTATSSTTTPQPVDDNNKTRLFDSFDWGSLSVSQYTGLDFSILPPSSPGVTPVTPISTVSQQVSVPRKKLYCGLLSSPDFETYLPIPQIQKPVTVSDSVHTHTISDFLAYGPTSRVSRSKINGKKGRLSRRSRTFQGRLETFRPLLQYRVGSLEVWKDAKLFTNIFCISSMQDSTVDIIDDNVAKTFTCDEMQGLGFQQYETQIVLIGYIFKVSSTPTTTVEKLCRNIGVLNIPLRPLANRPCLFLEDNTAKIRLNLSSNSAQKDLKFSQIVSGVPVAVRGMCIQGQLCVEEVLFATPPSPAIPLASVPNDIDMVFVSGLNIGRPYTNWTVLDSLFDYLQGLSGSEPDQDCIMKRKTRVFFIGNSFPKRKRWNADRREELVALNCDIADKIDYYLYGLTSTTEVFIIPGENDPAHQITLPQPPLHKQLFPNAMQNATLRCLTNPAKICLGMSDNSNRNEDSFDENVINLIVSSGVNVKETMRECRINCALDVCTRLLKWSHLHPSSTDDGEIAEDLFSLSSLPHLFLVGGLSDFKIKVWKGVKIVSVPSFYNTGKIIILDKNGAIRPLCFKVCIK